MKTKIYKMTLAILSAIAVLSASTAQAADIKAESKQALANFINKDSSLKNVLDKSAGYAIFPNIGKGGFIVGGAHGEGLVYEKGALIGKAKMTQASIGAQAGGQTFAELIVFENQGALNHFKGDNFEMAAQISGVVAAEGAGQAAKYQEGVAIFTLPKKGLMGEASIGGQKFKFEPLLK